jgi:hypothetical protein
MWRLQQELGIGREHVGSSSALVAVGGGRKGSRVGVSLPKRCKQQQQQLTLAAAAAAAAAGNRSVHMVSEQCTWASSRRHAAM